MLGNGTNAIDCALSDEGILLVCELFLEKFDCFAWDGRLFDRTVQKGGNVGCGGVGLILSLGDGEFVDELLKGSDGLLGLFA